MYSSQVILAGIIMIIVFGLIMTEVCIGPPVASPLPMMLWLTIPLPLWQVLHRTMAAMIGAALTLVILALQNRVPSLSTVVGALRCLVRLISLFCYSTLFA